jgi:ComF family protein
VSIGTAFLDLVYPRSCAGCGGVLGKQSGHLCWDCLAGLQLVTDPMCSICGDPVEGKVGHRYECAFCVRRRPHFDRARSAARFRGPLKAAIHSLKYGDCVHLSRDFALLLRACVATHFSGTSADMVTFVPLHPKRERERTYNQSAAMAGLLARALRIPAGPCLRRVRDTGTQTGLSAHDRRENMRGAFEAVQTSWIEGRSLLLVDDVMTTGATVDECAKVLKKAGAAYVGVVTVARG